MQIRRATIADLSQVADLLEEFYADIGVQLKDSAAQLTANLASPDYALWLALIEGTPAGCVALRPLPSISGAGEVVRVFVRPAFRGRAIANSLLATLEAHAQASRYEALYLDSLVELHAALHIYTSRGFLPCSRYNDDPQSTVFLRKPLPPL